MHLLQLTCILCVGALVSSCGRKEISAKPRDDSATKVEQLEKQIRDLRVVHDRQTEEMVVAITRKQQEAIEALQQQHQFSRAELARRVTELEKKLDEKNLKIARLKQASAPGRNIDNTIPPSIVPPAITHFTRPKPDVSDFLVVTGEIERDPFPLRIVGVSGGKVVVGKHSSIRWVETDETAKDDYGNLRNVMKKEKFSVDDYDYQVGFTASNLTGSAQTVQFRAGKKWGSIRLAPAQAKKLKVDSAMGASLIVRVGKKSRSYPVSYP